MACQTHSGIDPIEVGSSPQRRDGDWTTRSVLIVDDHALVRHGLSLVVGQRFPGVTIVEAGTLRDAVRKLPSIINLAAVLYDLRMGDSDGLEGLDAMLRASGDVPLIVVSGVDGKQVATDCIRAGARGFVSKGCEGAVLDQALPIVLAGGIYAPPPPPSMSVGRSSAKPVMEAKPALSKINPVDELTDRQREVLSLLLEGQSNKEIARALGVLEGTIKVHLRTIMQRLGARNRTQLALAAVRAGAASL